MPSVIGPIPPHGSSLLKALCVGALLLLPVHLPAAERPRGFFVMDFRLQSSTQTPRPSFYNLDKHQLETFSFKQTYTHFIDIDWDRDRGRVIFSAKHSSREPYRIYTKAWPDGDEAPIYENPLGPFRFLRSPDGQRLALQIMGPSAWPTVGSLVIESGKLTALGTGYSPDWSADSQRFLFLKIPDALPSYLMEYRVETDTATQLRQEPVMEAVYTDDPEQIIFKSANRAKRCDMFQVWNRRKEVVGDFCRPLYWTSKKSCTSEREIGVFPGHQAFYFKESLPLGAKGPALPDPEHQSLIVCDVWGGRLQSLAHDDWSPTVTAVDETTFLVGEDPLAVLSVDGAGGRTEIPNAGFIRAQR